MDDIRKDLERVASRPSPALFGLGHIEVSDDALQALLKAYGGNPDSVAHFLLSHSRGDWPELTDHEREMNASAVEVGHLEDIGHYASLKTCRRARLLSYFGDGDAELVAPCDGCDVCQGGGKSTRRRNHASNPPNPGTSSILGRALNGLREAVFGTFATDGTEAAARK